MRDSLLSYDLIASAAIHISREPVSPLAISCQAFKPQAFDPESRDRIDISLAKSLRLSSDASTQPGLT
jgi:hypothetical protein